MNFIRNFKKKCLRYYHLFSNKEHLKWVDIDGDKTLRLEYPLNNDSVVFDVGGYEGQWASDIFAKYLCNVYVFEPVKIFSALIAKRFEHNAMITVFPFGLSDHTSKTLISHEKDGSSVFHLTEDAEEIDLVCFLDFVKLHSIKKIDLLKLNIEGGEYDVLESLIKNNYIHNIGQIQVQFHSFVPDADDRMRKIQIALSETHQITYQFNYIWENWKKKV